MQSSWATLLQAADLVIRTDALLFGTPPARPRFDRHHSIAQMAFGGLPPPPGAAPRPDAPQEIVEEAEKEEEEEAEDAEYDYAVSTGFAIPQANSKAVVEELRCDCEVRVMSVCAVQVSFVMVCCL